MSELTFPLYFQFGKIYFKWEDSGTYIKSHIGIPGFGYGISKYANTQITLGSWLNDNPLATQITPDEYQTHFQEILSEIQKGK